MFCTGTFPDCWRFIEVLTSSFAQVFVEAGNLRFNRQPPTPKMHHGFCMFLSWTPSIYHRYFRYFPPFCILGLGDVPRCLHLRCGCGWLYSGRGNPGRNGPGNEKVLARWIWIPGVFFMFFSKFGSSGSSGSLYISKSLWVKWWIFRVKSLGVRPFFGGPTGLGPASTAPGLLRRAPGGGERRRARGGGALAGGAAGLMCQSGATATAATAGKWLRYHYTL